MRWMPAGCIRISKSPAFAKPQPPIYRLSFYFRRRIFEPGLHSTVVFPETCYVLAFSPQN